MPELSVQPEVTYGHASGERDYIPPNLFEAYYGIRHEDRRRRYVMEELQRMVNEKTLSITDLLAQPAVKRDEVGRILKNIVIDVDSRTERVARDHERTMPLIAEYPVTIRVVGDRAESVSFQRGWMPHPDHEQRALVGTRTGKTFDTKDSADGAWGGAPVQIEEFVDYKTREATLPLWEAWICMSRNGKHCCTAIKLSAQMRKWKFEESNHPTNQKPESEPRKVGRPKGS